MSGRVQVVFLNRGSGQSYTYSTSLDLAVGDVVLVPSFIWPNGAYARVVALESDYDGDVQRVFRKVPVEEYDPAGAQ